MLLCAFAGAGLLTVLRTSNAEASGGRLTACTPGGVRRFALLGMGAGGAMRGLLATDNWRRGIRCSIRLVPLLGPACSTPTCYSRRTSDWFAGVAATLPR